MLLLLTATYSCLVRTRCRSGTHRIGRQLQIYRKYENTWNDIRYDSRYWAEINFSGNFRRQLAGIKQQEKKKKVNTKLNTAPYNSEHFRQRTDTNIVLRWKPFFQFFSRTHENIMEKLSAFAAGLAVRIAGDGVHRTRTITWFIL